MYNNIFEFNQQLFYSSNYNLNNYKFHNFINNTSKIPNSIITARSPAVTAINILAIFIAINVLLSLRWTRINNPLETKLIKFPFEIVHVDCRGFQRGCDSIAQSFLQAHTKRIEPLLDFVLKLIYIS